MIHTYIVLSRCIHTFKACKVCKGVQTADPDTSSSQDLRDPVYQWTLGSLYSVKNWWILSVCCHLFHLIITFPRCTFWYCSFLCHSFCCGHAVRAYSMSFTKTGFLSSVKPILFLPPLPSPLLLEATLYADEMLLMVFLLWAEVFCDFWFGFQQLQTNEPPFSLKPDSHVRIGWETQNAEKSDFFLSSSQTSKLQTPFLSSATLLCYSLHWFFLFFLLHALNLLSIIYTFKHEACLIHCEVSQWATYECDNQNMSLCSLAAPWLEFHFIMSKTITPLPLHLTHLLSFTKLLSSWVCFEVTTFVFYVLRFGWLISITVAHSEINIFKMFNEIEE